jgi:hypothetical protein
MRKGLVPRARASASGAASDAASSGAFGHSVSLAARNTASANRPLGFIARRTFAKVATGSLKNMIPKRENASSKLSGVKGWTEASATMASACRRPAVAIRSRARATDASEMHWRNPEHRELYLSGLRLAAGEET